MTTFSPSPPSSSADLRVPLLLTLLFWPAVISLVVFSPSLVVDLIAVPVVFAVYFLTLIGYGLLVDVRDQRTHKAQRRRRHSYSRLSDGLPSHLSVASRSRGVVG